MTTYIRGFYLGDVMYWRVKGDTITEFWFKADNHTGQWMACNPTPRALCPHLIDTAVLYLVLWGIGP